MPREFWRAPRLWPGETVVVMATGESLTQQQADYVRGKARVIAVNDAYRLAPWADVLYAADAKWWRVHLPNLGGFAGLMVGAQEGIEFPRVHVIRHDRAGEKSKFDDPGFVQGNNSGAEALQLAYHMNGGAPIVALGCDCRGRHFFGNHPPPLNTNGSAVSYAWGFEHVGRHLAARGVRVVNCSPISALTCFEKAALEDVLPARRSADELQQYFHGPQ